MVGCGCCCHCFVPSLVQRDGLEIPFFFAVLHGAFAALVVHASAALRDSGGGHLVNDLLEGVGVAFKSAGDGQVTEGPKTDMHHFGRLFWAEVEVVGVGEDLACATDTHAVMREVERRQGDVLTEDVVPHVELRPVVQGEDAEVLAWRVHTIEQIPKLGALVLGVPLAEVVAVGKEAFLGACLFLVASRPADARVELVFLDGVDERRRLEAVAARVGARFLLHLAGVDGRLDATYDEASAEAFDEVVTELDRLGKVVSRVDVHQWHRDASWGEGLGREVGHHDAVLAP